VNIYFFCEEKQKVDLFLYHLEGLCVPLLVGVPQFGDNWCKVFTSTRNALDFKHALQ